MEKITKLGALADAIQQECAPEDEGSVCTGFVVVSEWVDLDGNPHLTRVVGDPRGSFPPPWRTSGWLSSALNWSTR